MKLVPGKAYTRQQLQENMTQEDADSLKWQGYVLQYDMISQTYTLVPWHQATAQFTNGERRPVRAQGPVMKPLTPIVKRTPAQRVDSLMAKWLMDMKAAGGLPKMKSPNPPPGLTQAERDTYHKERAQEERILEDKIKEIVGEAWKAGRTEITADVVRQVAAHFLGLSEREHEAKLAKQITRAED